MFDFSSFGLSSDVQSVILQSAVAASCVLSAVEKLAGKSKTLAAINSFLKFVPRVKLGK